MKKTLFSITFMMLILPGFCGELKFLVLQPGPQDGFDSYINTAYPDEPGWDKGLLLTAWTLGGNPYVGKSLLRFNLSELTPYDSIVDARLSLYFDPNGSWPEHSGNNHAHIRRIISVWDYMTVTYNTQPAVTDTGMIYLPQSVLPHQNYTDIDVTEFARFWIANPAQNFGMMASLDTTEPYAALVFASCETTISANRPKLVVTYLSCDPPVASFDYIVEEKTVSFEDQSSSATSWNWDFGDGYHSTLQHPFHTYLEYGIYEVCLTIEDSCGMAMVCDTIKVCEGPAPHYQYQTENLIVSFFDSSTMPLSWLWDFGDGFFSDLQNPVHVFSDSGTYYVCETVTNYCGTETFCDSITLKATGIFEVPRNLQFTIYPNPAQDFLFIHIQSPGNKEIFYRIFNSQGIIVAKKRTFAKTKTAKVPVDLTEYSKGIYYLHLRVNGKNATRKFLIL